MTEKMREILESRQAPGAIVRGNIAYASPIDGKAITTHRARQYDLEASGCVDAREGREMASDARKGWKRDVITMEDVKKAAESIGVL